MVSCSCRARAVLFRAVPVLTHRAWPIWPSIIPCVILIVDSVSLSTISAKFLTLCSPGSSVSLATGLLVGRGASLWDGKDILSVHYSKYLLFILSYNLLSLYLSVKRRYHVRREGLEIPTLIQKKEEYTPLDFMKI
jgi:hypothetical protein